MKDVYRRLMAAVLCTALGAALLCPGLTACTRSPQGSNSETDSGNGGTAGQKQVTLTVWGAQEDQQLLKEMCDAYAKENTDKTYKFNFGVLGEGNSSDKILGDVEAGPDVFSFHEIQTFRVV